VQTTEGGKKVKKLSKKGVSPVIATILLIAITVVAVGVVMAFVVMLPKPTTPLSAVINIGGAVKDSETLVISHMSGDPIMAMLTSMEVRINGTTQNLPDATLNGNAIGISDFTVGDRLVLTVPALSSGDVIAVVYKPANQILASVTVPGPITAGVWSASEYIDPATTSAGDVWFVPKNGTTSVATYSDELHANTGDNKLGAFQVRIAFDPAVIQLDTSVSGGAEGPSGWSTTVNAENNESGVVVINSFSTTGLSAGNDVKILTLHWKKIGAGTTTLDLTVEDLVDVDTGHTIGTPNGIDGERILL